MNADQHGAWKGSWVEAAVQGVLLLGYGLYTSMLVTTSASYRLLSPHVAALLPVVSTAFYLAAARTLIIALLGGRSSKRVPAGRVRTLRAMIWYTLFWLPLIIGLSTGVY